MEHATVGTRGRRAGRWMVAAVMAVIGAAGVFKAADLPGFQDTVQTWKLLGSVTRWVVVLALPAAEMLLALLWFLDIERRRMEAVAAVLLAAFAATYGAHLVLTEAPKCGCFGLIDEYFEGLSAGRAGLWRDGVMLVTLASGMWLSRGTAGERACSGDVRRGATGDRAGRVTHAIG